VNVDGGNPPTFNGCDPPFQIGNRGCHLRIVLVFDAATAAVARVELDGPDA
jgi:hypothetical protein